jgi:hypothetical protein
VKLLTRDGQVGVHVVVMFLEKLVGYIGELLEKKGELDAC